MSIGAVEKGVQQNERLVSWLSLEAGCNLEVGTRVVRVFSWFQFASYVIANERFALLYFASSRKPNCVREVTLE